MRKPPRFANAICSSTFSGVTSAVQKTDELKTSFCRSRTPRGRSKATSIASRQERKSSLPDAATKTALPPSSLRLSSRSAESSLQPLRLSAPMCMNASGARTATAERSSHMTFSHSPKFLRSLTGSCMMRSDFTGGIFVL